jgi:hypothetical protein
VEEAVRQRAQAVRVATRAAAGAGAAAAGDTTLPCSFLKLHGASWTEQFLR